MAVDSSLLGLNEIKHIGNYGQQYSLTLHVIVIGHTGLRIECYGIRMIVVTTGLIGNLNAMLCIAIVRRASVVVMLMIADVDMVKSGVNIGLMMTALAGKGHDVTCRQYRNV